MQTKNAKAIVEEVITARTDAEVKEREERIRRAATDVLDQIKRHEGFLARQETDVANTKAHLTDLRSKLEAIQRGDENAIKPVDRRSPTPRF